MRAWIWIALLASPLPATAADWKVDCPAQLATAQTIAGTVPADWAPIARGVSAVREAKPPASDTDTTPPISVSIFDGPPVDMVDLVPDDPNARVVRWTFGKGQARDNIYVVCHYADTRLALTRKAPNGISLCQLSANAPGVVCR
jgi:hypothetical protein